MKLLRISTMNTKSIKDNNIKYFQSNILLYKLKMAKNIKNIKDN